jgi:predicted DNA-binding transcriptional regulator AlpA
MQATATAINTAPSIEVLSPSAVYRAIGLNSSTVWRLRQRGDFPEPIRLSPGRVGYRRADIERWLQARAEAR